MEYGVKQYDASTPRNSAYPSKTDIVLLENRRDSQNFKNKLHAQTNYTGIPVFILSGSIFF
jgi:hypothetical protein